MNVIIVIYKCVTFDSIEYYYCNQMYWVCVRVNARVSCIQTIVWKLAMITKELQMDLSNG